MIRTFLRLEPEGRNNLERASFIFTIFFLLLGPVKIIPAFHRLTRQTDSDSKRKIAFKASLIASMFVAIIAVFGDSLAAKYRISLDAVRIAGGLVLLISALKLMFPGAEPSGSGAFKPTSLEIAISPLATPIIVPPAGIAAILIFIMMAPQFPGSGLVIALALTTMMVLDFLAMFFADEFIQLPGLSVLLQVVGSALVFIQLALSIEVLLAAFRSIRANA